MGLVVAGSAGVAFWITGFTTKPEAPPPAIAAAEPFAARFSADWNKPDALPAPAWIAPIAGGAEQFATLTRPDSTAGSGDPDAGRLQGSQAASTGALGSPSPAAVRRAADRKPTVFNEAQIASIKKRLNLTKDQEEYWPAVEAELRRLAWKKSPDGPHHKGARHLVALDVNAVDVAKLRSTTAPLLMSFNDEQKRELRTLAHLAGMQDLFPNL
jgi:hypothetical protein